MIDHLERLDATHLGVVLKIETRAGFENLPKMLLAGMRLPRFGVMIARGDGRRDRFRTFGRNSGRDAVPV